MKKTIAILFHEKHDMHRVQDYVIWHLAKIWNKDGHNLVFIFGVEKFAPADVCIVHVDLSVVPNEYIEFASRYPITINGDVRDIRKSIFSKNIVRPHDQYKGKVIVKSDLNYAGVPELKILKSSVSNELFKEKVKHIPPHRRLNSPDDYKIYEQAGDVPPVYYQDPFFIVEKFFPEKIDDLYFVHLYLFLGDSRHCFRLGSKDPIVNGATSISNEIVKPHADIIKMQKEMGFDYGKFDYCINDGKVVLLDINKTIGNGGIEYTKQLAIIHRERAEGLYAYFQ